MSIDRLIESVALEVPPVSGDLDEQLAKEIRRKGLTSTQYRRLLGMADKGMPETGVLVMQEALNRDHYGEVGDYLARLVMQLHALDPELDVYESIEDILEDELGIEMSTSVAPTPQQQLVFYSMMQTSDRLSPGRENRYPNAPTAPTIAEIGSIMLRSIPRSTLYNYMPAYLERAEGAEAFYDHVLWLGHELLLNENTKLGRALMRTDQGGQMRDIYGRVLGGLPELYYAAEGDREEVVDVAFQMLREINRALPHGITIEAHEVPGADEFVIEMNHPSHFEAQRGVA